MYDMLFQAFAAKINLTDDEKEFCKSIFIPRKIRKKQYLLQEGDVSRYTAFVNKGCLRSYSVNEKGAEHIVQFALEGWWIGDMYSFLTGEPSSFNIDALEDSELLLIDKPSQDKLFEQVPKFERFFRLLLENNYIATHRRLMSTISGSAEERYLAFANTYPQIIQRVPQHMVASYLGLTPETVSRLRQQIAKRG
jgi:CRP-like cAMP-binding protein